MKTDTTHKQKTFIHKNKKYTVDKQIAPLIKQLLKAGIVPIYSCIGNKKTFAYLTIDTTYLKGINIDDNKLTITWSWKTPELTRLRKEKFKPLDLLVRNKYGCYGKAVIE